MPISFPFLCSELRFALARQTNPANAASAAGVVIGKLTYEGTRRRLGVEEVLLIMLFKLRGRAVMALLQALIVSAQERAQKEGDIVTCLKAEGVDITPDEAAAILDEVLANPQLLHNTLQELERAFARL